MKSSALILLSATALSLAACGHKSDAPDGQASASADAAAMASATPSLSVSQSFANSMASGDAFEVASSKLAATSAGTASVKTFAAAMIKAHTDSTVKLQEAAAKASPAVVPDATLTADQQASLEALKTLNGAAFDQAYAKAQVAGHEQALSSLNLYAKSGDAPSLKAAATAMIPVVTAHLNMAKGLKP
ncbi:DUF4142 domain-containing protein [Novosphingobium lentum]|uniref:DUF4142 domain-containing protein n=1 Tax=Novosphingobium lentum TaxID=145287 RepID=UPI00082E8ADB|nr:DUF4142 domain-containing protein [Novosphingobium lentum]